MKISKSAANLLARQFTYNGRPAGSAVHTCEGTLPLWGQLVLAGLVEPIPKLGLGHPFSYRITDAGRKFLWDEWSPYDFPFYCYVCKNTFRLKEHLIEHANRKHRGLGVPV